MSDKHPEPPPPSFRETSSVGVSRFRVNSVRPLLHARTNGIDPGSGASFYFFRPDNVKKRVSRFVFVSSATRNYGQVFDHIRRDRIGRFERQQSFSDPFRSVTIRRRCMFSGNTRRRVLIDSKPWTSEANSVLEAGGKLRKPNANRRTPYTGPAFRGKLIYNNYSYLEV